MRILMLAPHPTVRGPLPKHTPVLVEALRDAGCDVQTAAWGRHSDEQSFAMRALSRVGDIKRIRDMVAATRFDVLVVKTSHEWVSVLRDLPLLLATRGASPHIVLQFHGSSSHKLSLPGSGPFKLASRLLFRLADGVLVLSSEEARYGAEFYPDRAFLTVVNPYVASGDATGAQSRRTSPNAVPTVLYVGRVIPEKGVMETLEAFAAVRARRPCRLVIAGTGDALEMVRRRANELGVSSDVTLAGHVTGEALASLYRNADVFTLPTYWPEGFPTAITEAMMAGLPIVTTKLRGMADHLDEPENALFVPPRAAMELAAAIERLLDDEPLRGRMGAANRTRVEAFAPASAARRYLEALQEIAG